jgi:hypothetical protein
MSQDMLIAGDDGEQQLAPGDSIGDSARSDVEAVRGTDNADEPCDSKQVGSLSVCAYSCIGLFSENDRLMSASLEKYFGA